MLSAKRPSAVSDLLRPAARLALGGLLALLLTLVISATAHGAARPVVFGIYPGGAAGTVGPDNATRPEVPELRRQALLRLRRPGRPFVVRIYDEYRQPSDEALPSWLAAQIAAYAADGLKIELVLPYRPASPVGDVAGYVDFVRARVRQFGPNPNVTDLQVTNEANVRTAPNAADGAYPGVHDALVWGVTAAKTESRAGGFGQLRVGFSWADQNGGAERAFFSTLKAKGGAAFTSAVDWVGVDAYPGTWGPRLPKGKLSSAVRKATIRTMRRLRTKLMPAGGLRAARIHFSEAGYPTGPRRTTAMQKTVMRSAVKTVAKYRAKYGVTDFRWFDLRDANSSSASFESQYGLMKDDYSPKPAFHTFRKLVSRQR